jgi:hypothetical protein
MKLLSSEPTKFEIDMLPPRISDFDWLGTTFKGSPLVAVAMQNTLRILRVKEIDDQIY